MNARTPGPWRCSREDDCVEIGNDTVRVALVVTDNCDDVETAMDDARFIVSACNAHDSLIAERNALLRLVYDAIVNLDPMDAPNWTGPVYRDVISKVLCDLRGAIVNMPFARAELSKLMGRAAKVGE